jgi:hypothetical protein
VTAETQQLIVVHFASSTTVWLAQTASQPVLLVFTQFHRRIVVIAVRMLIVDVDVDLV